MEAADKTDSPVIVQASAGARKYACAPFLRHLILAAVEEFPHIAHRIPATGQVPIQSITDGGQQKDDGGGKARPSTREEEEQEGDKGDGPYAEEGEFVG